jgi:hypothetical protein
MKRIWKLAMLVSVGVCVAAWWGIAAAESEEAGEELQNYFSNANTSGGQAFVNITAPLEGNRTASSLAVKKGEICAMIYVFDTAQDLQSCCGCPITADGLLTLSISGNLAPNPVGSTSILMDGSIRILSSFPNAIPPPPGDSLFPGENCDPSTFQCCDPAARTTGNTVTPGSELVAWASHIQGTQITENEFQAAIPATGTTTTAMSSSSSPSSSSFESSSETAATRGRVETVEAKDVFVRNKLHASLRSKQIELLDDPEFGGLPQACADITQLGSGAGTCTCPSEVPPP